MIDKHDANIESNFADRFDFYTRIGFLCVKLENCISREFSARLEPLNLTHREAVLIWLCAKHKLSQNELCNMLNRGCVAIDKNVIRLEIDKLEALKLLKREQNPKNRRENIVKLTNKGKDIANQTYDLMLKVHEDIILKYISNEEYKHLHSLLHRIVKGIESINGI